MMHKILLKGKFASWKLLIVVICGLFIFTPTALSAFGYFRSPETFSVTAVFPLELFEVMKISKPRDFMPDNIAAVPGNVSDFPLQDVVEAYHVLDCFSIKVFTFSSNDKCNLNLYVWRKDGLPPLHVEVTAPVVWEGRRPNLEQHYSSEETLMVDGNVISITVRKSSENAIFFATFWTFARLIPVWAFYYFAERTVREYRHDMNNFR